MIVSNAVPPNFDRIRPIGGSHRSEGEDGRAVKVT